MTGGYDCGGSNLKGIMTTYVMECTAKSNTSIDRPPMNVVLTQENMKREFRRKLSNG